LRVCSGLFGFENDLKYAKWSLLNVDLSRALRLEEADRSPAGGGGDGVVVSASDPALVCGCARWLKRCLGESLRFGNFGQERVPEVWGFDVGVGCVKKLEKANLWPVSEWEGTDLRLCLAAQELRLKKKKKAFV